MKKISLIQTSIFISVVIFLSGCTKAQISFPEGTDQAAFTKHIVSGNNTTSNIFNEKYSIGAYKVIIDRSMTRSTSSGNVFKLFGGETNKTTQQGYNFNVTGPDKYFWKGECLSQVVRMDEPAKLFGFKVDSNESVTNTLQCFFSSTDNKKYELKMVETEMQEKTGEITGKNTRLTFKSSRKIKGSSFDSMDLTGYYISNNSGVISVIDLLNEGAVYISTRADSDTKSLILAVSVALISHREIKGAADKKTVKWPR